MSNDNNNTNTNDKSTNNKQTTEQQIPKNNSTENEKKNIPAPVDVNPNEFSGLKNAFSGRQEVLATIAVQDAYDIPFTEAEDPDSLDKIVKFNKLLKVHYNEITNGQMYALQKKKAIIDDMERTVTQMALQRADKNAPTPLNAHRLNQDLIDKKEEYYNNLFTLILDLPVDQRKRCARTTLYQVADAWEMRARFSLPKLANVSTGSSMIGVQ